MSAWSNRPSAAWRLVPLALACALALAGALRATQSAAPRASLEAPLARREGSDLSRCRAEGAAAGADASCIGAWREARDRFLQARR